MAPKKSQIDIYENVLRNRGKILDILLTDRTTSNKLKVHNIIWATDSYYKPGRAYTSYAPKKPILKEQITGKYGQVIQPRAAKSKQEQITRTKDKAEVFTPLSIVKQMNMLINEESKNWPVNKKNWLDYIKEIKLEITCGEAPFITSRYNPTINIDKLIDPAKRVGFLDNKLQVINRFVSNKKDWLHYAEIALKACYGYEWQGDNLLIARENILQTLDDFFIDFCKTKLNKKTKLTIKQLEKFAEIISWNIFQMDGLRYVVPMSCKHKETINTAPPMLKELGEAEDIVSKEECEGCKFNRPKKHNGKYVKIMDWERNKPIRFVDILKDK